MRERRGIGLAVVLILGLILFTLLKALVYLSASGAFNSRQHLEKTSALFLLEAGVADALTQFEQDSGWTDGFQDKGLSDMPGTYSVNFNTSGADFQPDDSYNNLQGTSPMDGFRGEGSVPPGAAEVVVVARMGTTERRVRVVLSDRPASTGYLGMAGNGNISLRGNVNVNGINSFSEGLPTRVNIQSNRADPVADIIRWEPVNPGDSASIDGDVSVISPAADAINFGPDPTAYSVDNFNLGADSQPVSRVDVAARVAANTSHPAPVFSLTGESRLNSGPLFHQGDLEVQGDLVLDGTDLYVAGNLTVNGSITGNGSVHIDGNTDFRGDAELLGFDPDGVGVALYSEGNVTLTGYDGTAYMETVVAGDANAQLWWDDEVAALNAFQVGAREALDSDSIRDFIEAGTYEGLDDILGEDANGNSGTYQGRTRNATGKLTGFLQSQPASSTNEFMLERLDWVQRYFADPNATSLQDPPGVELVMQQWMDGDTSLYGILEACEDGRNYQVMAAMLPEVVQFSYQGVGSATFQGTVYTNGFFYAANEVAIVGALHSGGERAGATPTTIGNHTLYPGDIYLDNNSTLTLVEEIAQEAGTSGASYHVRTWISD